MGWTDLLPSSVRLKERIQSAAASGKLGSWGGLRHLEDLASTPTEVIYQEGALQLSQFVFDREPTRGYPIVLIPSLINRYYVLDLLPDRSLIRFLGEKGFDVYVVEWGTPEDEDRYLTLERLIDGRLKRAIRSAAEHSGAEKVHLLGHCLGGTVAAAFAGLHPDLVASLPLMTTPLDFNGKDLLSVWSRHPSFDLDSYIEAHGNMPWPIMQAAFYLMRPASMAFKLIKASPRFRDEDFVTGFIALETWGSDNVSFPGHCYRDLIRSLYRENALMKDGLKVGRRRVKFSDVKCPVLSIAGAADHIVPAETTLKECAASGTSPQVTSWMSEGGHIGAILGKKAQREVWPMMAEWLERQEE